MSDTARDIQNLDPVSVEGLDQFFHSSDTPGQDSLDTQDDTSDIVEATLDTSPDTATLTVQEAAQLYKVSPRTILRRLNKGTLNGFKIDGTYGVEWRVNAPVSSDTPGQDSLDTQDDTSDIVEATLDTPDIDHDNPLVSELRDQVNRLRLELNSQRLESQHQLQAAAFRNGYLEAQLNAKDEQIKLLTDSQQNPGMWRRFTKWFLGQ